MTISVVGYGGWEAGGAAWGAEPSEERELAALAGRMRGWGQLGRHGRDLRQRSFGGADRRAIWDRPEIIVSTKVASARRGLQSLAGAHQHRGHLALEVDVRLAADVARNAADRSATQLSGGTLARCRSAPIR